MERFVIIEDFNGTIALVTDEEGNTKVFGSFSEAVTEADECQNGVVVPLQSLKEVNAQCKRMEQWSQELFNVKLWDNLIKW